MKYQFCSLWFEHARANAKLNPQHRQRGLRTDEVYLCHQLALSSCG